MRFNSENIVQEETKHGQWLRVAVEARKEELERRLAELQNSEHQSSTVTEGIEDALNVLEELMPGDRENITPSVASRLAHWLDSNKHLGEIVAPRHTGRRSRVTHH
jgi:hypothetical protein